MILRISLRSPIVAKTKWRWPVRVIKLTQGYQCQVNDEDYEWLSKYKWSATVVKDKEDAVKYVYATSAFYERGGTHTTVQMHRFLLDVDDPQIRVDHRDR